MQGVLFLTCTLKDRLSAHEHTFAKELLIQHITIFGRKITIDRAHAKRAVDYIANELTEFGMDMLRLFAVVFPETYLRLHARLRPGDFVNEHVIGNSKLVLVGTGSGRDRIYNLFEEDLTTGENRAISGPGFEAAV